METQMFSAQVIDRLEYYVYRLIDPRNGETFYVGKGTGNRVFAHAKGEIGMEDDALSEKLKRIREIRLAGLEVLHVIHRHGLSQDTALEVEAALIDAYPEATNLMNGKGSDDRGLMHALQIVERYEAKEVIFQHKVVLININRSADENDTYEAVRFAWKLDPEKASKTEFVLAVRQGLIVGAFIADQWLKATKENFPGISEDEPDRWGFIGRPAPNEIVIQYLRKRLPDGMRKKGASNPIRYVFP